MVQFADVINITNLLMALGTLVLVFIAYWTIRDNQKTRLGDFLLRLHDAFFYKQNNPLIINCIEINKPILKKNGGTFKDIDLDNFLGFIELLSFYIKEEILREEIVKHVFGYYIIKANNNNEIKQYIEDNRIKNGQHIYQGFTSLSLKFS